MIENIMEHISQATGKDPIQVRLNNMNATDKEILDKMITDLKTTSDYDARQRSIKIFNNVSSKYLL